MTALHTFHLPDVGEGLTEADIVGWHVSIGDTVAINDLLVEIETAKSTVELPSPYAGLVDALHVQAGDTVAVGNPLVSVRPATPELIEEKPKVLVGSGPSSPSARRHRLVRPVPGAEITPAPREELPARVSGQTGPPKAKPPTRFRARQLGVDLASIVKQDDGIITREDVERAAVTVSDPSLQTARERRIPIKGVRKAMASAMVRSAFTAPHVTEWLTVDVTAMMRQVSRLKRDPSWADVRVSPLLFVAKALVLAAKKHPLINSTWDEANQEIVEKHYVNLGIAAATPRGLLVPNIKNADSMELLELASSLNAVVDRARTGEIESTEMRGGTITITNIGALGVDAGTPIINPGESAILAFGAVREMPWIVDGEIVKRHVTQLALSFDHRTVDGELGSKVLTDVGRLLHDPGETLLYI